VTSVTWRECNERSVAETDARPTLLSDVPGLWIGGNGHNGLGLFNDAPMYDLMQTQRIFEFSLFVSFKIRFWLTLYFQQKQGYWSLKCTTLLKHLTFKESTFHNFYDYKHQQTQQWSIISTLPFPSTFVHWFSDVKMCSWTWEHKVATPCYRSLTPKSITRRTKHSQMSVTQHNYTFAVNILTFGMETRCAW